MGRERGGRTRADWLPAPLSQSGHHSPRRPKNAQDKTRIQKHIFDANFRPNFDQFRPFSTQGLTYLTSTDLIAPYKTTNGQQRPGETLKKAPSMKNVRSQG